MIIMAQLANFNDIASTSIVTTQHNDQDNKDHGDE